MDESNRGKEEENAIHKVGIRLGKYPKVEEWINVDEKSADEQPNVYVVASEVALKVYLRIQFTTDRKFEQRNHILSYVRDLAEKLGFVDVITKVNGQKGYVALGCQRLQTWPATLSWISTNSEWDGICRAIPGLCLFVLLKNCLPPTIHGFLG
jgi:hypothetical protein